MFFFPGTGRMGLLLLLAIAHGLRGVSTGKESRMQIGVRCNQCTTGGAVRESKTVNQRALSHLCIPLPSKSGTRRDKEAVRGPTLKNLPRDPTHQPLLPRRYLLFRHLKCV